MCSSVFVSTCCTAVIVYEKTPSTNLHQPEKFFAARKWRRDLNLNCSFAITILREAVGSPCWMGQSYNPRNLPPTSTLPFPFLFLILRLKNCLEVTKQKHNIFPKTADKPVFREISITQLSKESLKANSGVELAERNVSHRPQRKLMIIF